MNTHYFSPGGFIPGTEKREIAMMRDGELHVQQDDGSWFNHGAVLSFDGSTLRTTAINSARTIRDLIKVASAVVGIDTIEGPDGEVWKRGTDVDGEPFWERTA
jgi:hypothetical protein